MIPAALLALALLGSAPAPPAQDATPAGRRRPVVRVDFAFDDAPLLQEMLRSLSGRDEVARDVAAGVAASLGETIGFLDFVGPAAAGAPQSAADYELGITLVVVEGARASAAAAGGALGLAENGFLMELRRPGGDPVGPIGGAAAPGPATWSVPFVKSEEIQRAVRDGVIGGTIARVVRDKLREQRDALVRELFSRIPIPAGTRVFASVEHQPGPPEVYSGLVLLPFTFEQLGALRGTRLALAVHQRSGGRVRWRGFSVAASDDLVSLFERTEDAVAYFADQGLAADHPYWSLFPDPVVLAADEPPVAAADGAPADPAAPTPLHAVLTRKGLLAGGDAYHGTLDVQAVHVTRYLASDAALERRSPIDVLPRNPFDDPEP